MTDRSEEDTIARTPTMQSVKAFEDAEVLRLFNLGVFLSGATLEARANEIEAEGSASIFAGAIVSELRQQAQRLCELYVEG